MVMQKTFLFIAVAVFIVASGLLINQRLKHVKTSPAETFLNEIHSANRFLTTDEVAKRIINNDPSVYLVDVRSGEEFAAYSIPGSINIPLQNVLNNEWADSLNQTARDIIFYSNDDFLSEQAWALCRQQGFSNLYVMEGGLNQWFATIMLPPKPGELTSSDEIELYSFRTGASIYFGSGTVEVPVIKEVVVEEKPEPVVKKTIPVTKKAKVQDEGGC